jgi:hypothetical protein
LSAIDTISAAAGPPRALAGAVLVEAPPAARPRAARPPPALRAARVLSRGAPTPQTPGQQTGGPAAKPSLRLPRLARATPRRARPERSARPAMRAWRIAAVALACWLAGARGPAARGKLHSVSSGSSGASPRSCMAAPLPFPLCRLRPHPFAPTPWRRPHAGSADAVRTLRQTTDTIGSVQGFNVLDNPHAVHAQAHEVRQVAGASGGGCGLHARSGLSAPGRCSGPARRLPSHTLPLTYPHPQTPPRAAGRPRPSPTR